MRQRRSTPDRCAASLLTQLSAALRQPDHVPARRPRGAVPRRRREPVRPAAGRWPGRIATSRSCRAAVSSPPTSRMSSSAPAGSRPGARVQYVSLTTGTGGLFGSLHDVFDRDYPPTALHGSWRSCLRLLRAKGHPPRHQLIVTTNYDDVLERAFMEAGEPFDLVTYISEGDTAASSCTRTPDGQRTRHRHPEPVPRPVAREADRSSSRSTARSTAPSPTAKPTAT